MRMASKVCAFWRELVMHLRKRNGTHAHAYVRRNPNVLLASAQLIDVLKCVKARQRGRYAAEVCPAGVSRDLYRVVTDMLIRTDAQPKNVLRMLVSWLLPMRNAPRAEYIETVLRVPLTSFTSPSDKDPWYAQRRLTLESCDVILEALRKRQLSRLVLSADMLAPRAHCIRRHPKWVDPNTGGVNAPMLPLTPPAVVARTVAPAAPPLPPFCFAHEPVGEEEVLYDCIQLGCVAEHSDVMVT